MDIAAFWKLIDSTRRLSKGDPDAHIEVLTSALAKLPEADIIEFDRIFHVLWARAYDWNLWAAAYIIGGGCSDDGFMDFRGWLISKGPRVYEAALADPDSLAKVVKDDEEGQIEGFQYVAGQAWEKRTGRDYFDFPSPEVDIPREPTGHNWDHSDEEALAARFPKLFSKFWDA